jgi:hypothetical protein
MTIINQECNDSKYRSLFGLAHTRILNLTMIKMETAGKKVESELHADD